MTAGKHIKIGRLTALISFLTGTIIFGIYYMSSDFKLLFIGYVFVAIAGLLNLCVLIALLIKAAKDKANQKKLLYTSGLMLFNIPILFFFIWAILLLVNTMRITFINNTNTALTDLNIVGCEGGYIDELEVGGSETVWLKITGDCSILINYLSNGGRKEEYVVGYISINMGQKVNHKINIY